MEPSSVFRGAFAIMRAALRKITPFSRQRAAGTTPEKVRSLDDSILETAIQRLVGGRPNDPFHKRFPDAVAHLLITPPHLDTPNVVSWLSDLGVKADIMQAARRKSLGSEIPKEVLTRLQDGYAELRSA